MSFDPAIATAAYIDGLGPAALAKAAAYTTGSEWLLLWNVVVAAVAAAGSKLMRTFPLLYHSCNTLRGAGRKPISAASG